jgi:PAS domain S-box-containing protein
MTGIRTLGSRYLLRNVAWPLVVVIGFLIFVSASSIFLAVSSQSASELMNHALQIENKLRRILAIVRVAESGQRGYLLTGDPDYLDIYRSGFDESLTAIADMKTVTVDDPAQRRTVAEIESLVVRKFDELRETIRLHDVGDVDASLAFVRTGVGRDLMTKIGAMTLSLMQEQRRIVSLRTSSSTSTNVWLLVINLVGLALIIVLAAISVLMRRTAGKELAQSERRGDELQATMSERQKAEQKFEELLEAAPDAMIIVNQTGDIVLLNAQAEKLFGYRRDELIGQKKVNNIIPEGFAERLIADGTRTAADVLAQQIGTGIELAGRRKDGAEFPIEIMLSPLESAEGILVTAAIRDISVRQAAERHLVQMESRYRGLLEAAPDAMVVVNQGGEIVLLNLQAEKQFGYRRDELLGQKVKNIIPEGFAERLLADGLRSAEDALAQQIGTGIELSGRRKDGTEFPIEIMLSPLESAEGILVTAAIRNVSVRKTAETHLAQMEGMDRLKDEFVSTVSHELRTPLTSIAGALGLLIGNAAGQLPEHATRLLAIAHTNSQRLVRLINDILDIEKLESGKVIFNLKRVDVRALVEQAIEANRAFAEGYDVRVRLLDTPNPCAVRADPDRLEQVITNLLSNAIKFSPLGNEVLVAIELRGEAVRVSVRDHGPGISADFRSHIFQKFAQADATDGRQKGGTGLGLSIVKQITTRLDGVVDFNDAPGGGTIFHVDLPSWDHIAGQEIDLDLDSNAVRVLFCESHLETAISLRERLRQIGCATDFARTMGDALVCAEATHYAAIVVDLDLPDGHGMNLLLRLRQRVQTRNTPTVAVSADTNRWRNDPRSSRLDILDWFAKPLDIDRLVQALNKPIVRDATGRPLILHVDDDPDALRVVARALVSTADLVSIDSIEGARRAIKAKQFDLAILDLAVGPNSGLELLPDLRDIDNNAIPCVIFTAVGANLACNAQIQAALSKSHTSIDTLLATVHERLARRPPRASTEFLWRSA